MSQVLDVRLQYGLLTKHCKTKLLFFGESQLAEDVSSTVVDPLDCLVVQVSTELILQEVDSLVQGGTVLRNKNQEGLPC